MTQPRSAPASEAADQKTGSWVVARIGESRFRTDVEAGAHAFIADEPKAVGGTEMGPTPYEYLLAALSGCMAMTLRMYADRKKWPLEGVVVYLRSASSHEPDCEQCETTKVGIGRIERRVELAGPLTDEQRRRLMQIADRCPVKQSLERGIRIVDAA
jgi:putative redox protein